jgi:hypothetical protein
LTRAPDAVVVADPEGRRQNNHESLTPGAFFNVRLPRRMSIIDRNA